jgi:hypothetical protein
MALGTAFISLAGLIVQATVKLALANAIEGS